MNKKRRFKGGEIPTSSMADIAFLLLIFFLVTTTIDMDKGLGIVLPAEGEELEIKKTNNIPEYIESKTFVLKGHRIKIIWDENLKKKCLESFYPISKNI